MYRASSDFCGCFQLKSKSRKIFNIFLTKKYVFFNFLFMLGVTARPTPSHSPRPASGRIL